jgi:hypothetical protein
MLIFTALRAILAMPVIGIVRQAVRPQPVILRMNGQLLLPPCWAHNVFDPHCLFTTAPQLGQCFHLCGVGAQKLHCGFLTPLTEVAVAVLTARIEGLKEHTARVRRHLQKEGKRLRVARADKGRPYNEYYIVSDRDVVRRNVDLAALAMELGVLKPWEQCTIADLRMQKNKGKK